MSSVARWANNKPCTLWRKMGGNDENGDPLGFYPPQTILCDYIAGLSTKMSSLGNEIVAKNTFFTEFDQASEGDYLIIGESSERDPLSAGADEIKRITRWNDTLYGEMDDWALITGI